LGRQTQVGEIAPPPPPPPTHCPVQQWVARWVADGKNAPLLMRVRVEI
jgi:hypothetical protein